MWIYASRMQKCQEITTASVYTVVKANLWWRRLVGQSSSKCGSPLFNVTLAYSKHDENKIKRHFCFPLFIFVEYQVLERVTNFMKTSSIVVTETPNPSTPNLSKFCSRSTKRGSKRAFASLGNRKRSSDPTALYINKIHDHCACTTFVVSGLEVMRTYFELDISNVWLKAFG